ncbi:MAG: hypothetical protein EBT00_09135 [Proteobacteria bacterium]|nr:hypothetical protein [Pseudomonadota bacterium]NCV22134.1 hypothetical protein [Chloroflexota bacterium]NDG98670.1 hypothetical protein [Pseudomonadota bacterium]HAN16204.1 hypothetical protein [Chloroflexota bacterium]
MRTATTPQGLTSGNDRPDGVDGTLVAGFPGGCGLGIKRGAGTVRHLGDVNGHAPAGFRKM